MAELPVHLPSNPYKEHGRAHAGQECLVPVPLPGLHSSSTWGPALLEATALYKQGLPFSSPRAMGALQKWELPFPHFLYPRWSISAVCYLNSSRVGQRLGAQQTDFPAYLPICSQPQDGWTICWLLIGVGTGVGGFSFYPGLARSSPLQLAVLPATS